MDPACVGMPMAKEIAEVYYSQNRFYCTTTTDLKDMLLGDPFNIGVQPFEHVRRLVLRVDIPAFADTLGTEFEFLCNTYDHIKPLEMIKFKDRLKIEMTLETDLKKRRKFELEQERLMHNILETIRQPVYDLMFAGSKVEVRQSIDEANAYGTRCLVYAGSNRRFFGFTMEEWYKVPTIPNITCGSTLISIQEKNEQPIWDPSRHFISKTDIRNNEVEFRRIFRERWGRTHALKGFSYLYPDYLSSSGEDDGNDDGDTIEDWEMDSSINSVSYSAL
jgi:hypothetical protein